MASSGITKINRFKLPESAGVSPFPSLNQQNKRPPTKETPVGGVGKGGTALFCFVVACFVGVQCLWFCFWVGSGVRCLVPRQSGSVFVVKFPHPTSGTKDIEKHQDPKLD